MEDAAPALAQEVPCRYVQHLETPREAALTDVFPGQDLHGNTYWEFKDALNHNRWRRMVQGRRRTPLSDVQVSPQWHQWLRQTRFDPPTLQEQAADVQRQAQLKMNAQLADQRWAAKAKYFETPKATAASQLPGRPHDGSSPHRTTTAQAAKGDDQRENANETGANPGANWTPESWVPGPSRR